MGTATPHWDVIVAGLGAMGSATLHQLAHRGLKVLGIDRYAPPHDHGSSHGRSRIIREAYFEDPRYVPLVQRAYQCWRAIELESGMSIFRQTGGLMLGSRDSTVVRGARHSAELHGLAHEVLTADEVRHRYPAFHLRDDDVGILEPRAGMLDPELAISTCIDLALVHGAELRTGEAVRAWRAVASGIEVETEHGRHHADRLVLTVGAWTGAMCPGLSLPLVVQRNLLYWFDPVRDHAAFAPARFPVFIHELSADLTWYGFPDTGDGVKLALHHHGVPADPDTLQRTVTDAEVAFMREVVAAYMPDANGALRDTAACMYTNLPDSHFLIDTHPQHAGVIVASPCSGHGFKFASAIGEVLADMATGQPVAFDTSLFSLDRFRAPA
ncbi:MAG: N-methyl-L-tryptophan oxidase [Gemmatimonadaceae bacterium]|nr:N-methyl-L-tryptophan oxidase [Gemmatimonadaceae bacterium]